MGENNYGNGRFSRPRINNQETGRFPKQQAGDLARTQFGNLIYDSAWITCGADEKLVKYAEEAGKFMAKNGLTNSKIRSIYGEIKRIQMGDFEKEKSSFFLLKPKVAYALGRDDKNEGLSLFKLIFDKCSADVKDRKTYINFCNFIEAILAYHKANGGKD